MMPESKSAWRQALLDAYLRWKYRQRFYQVRVGGFPGWQEWLRSEAPYPLIWFGNHETWWDGLLDFSLTRRFGMDNRLMMEAKNLRQFPFFQKCGVFGVELDSPRGRADGLLHAVHLLKESSQRRCLILYPHGRLTQPWEDPPFQPGLTAMLKRAPNATALPVWREMRFGAHELPTVEIQLGQVILPQTTLDDDALRLRLDQTRNALISRLKADDCKEVFYIYQRRKPLRGETV